MTTSFGLLTALCLAASSANAGVVCSGDNCMVDCDGWSDISWLDFELTNAPDVPNRWYVISEKNGFCSVLLTSINPNWNDYETEWSFTQNPGVDTVAATGQFEKFTPTPGSIYYGPDCSFGCNDLYPPEVVGDAALGVKLYAKGKSGIKAVVAAKNGMEGIPWYCAADVPNSQVNYLGNPQSVTLLVLSWVDTNGNETFAFPVMMPGVPLNDPSKPGNNPTFNLEAGAVQVTGNQIAAYATVSYVDLNGQPQSFRVEEIFNGVLELDGDPGVWFSVMPQTICTGWTGRPKRRARMNLHHSYNTNPFGAIPDWAIQLLARTELEN